MIIVREIGVYDTSKDCNLLLKPTSFPKICSWKATIFKYFLKSPIKKIITSLLRAEIGLDYISQLDIKDPPTVYPVWEGNVEPKQSGNIEDLIQTNSKLPYKTISDYHTAYLNKVTTPTKVALKLLEIIKTPEIKSLNAIIESHEDEILEAADQSTKRYEEGKYKSIIDGIPFFCKEEIFVKGYKYSMGLTQLSGTSEYTANCLKLLLDSGAVLFGTTSMVQLGTNAIGNNPSKKFPSVRNPWNTDYYCGGSSSGCGCVVAAGLCPFSIAVDGLGSIRIPAGLTGQVGLRSTFSRITNAFINDCGADSQYTVIGPIACCVRDSAIIYAILAGKDNDFKIGLNQPNMIVPSLRTWRLDGVKFGVCMTYIKNGSINVYNAFKEVETRIKESGGSIHEIEIPELYETHIACVVGMSMYSQSYLKLPAYKEPVTNSEDISVKTIVAISETISDIEMDKIYRQRTRSMRIVENVFKQVDILLLLNTASSALPLLQEDSYDGFVDSNQVLSHLMFAGISSLTGIPAISLTVGQETSSKLPISIQILSKWWNEDFLLDVANQIETMFTQTYEPSVFSCPLN